MFKGRKLKLYRREDVNLFLKNILISDKYLYNLLKKKYYSKKNNNFSIFTHFNDQLKEKRKLKIIYGISNKKYNFYYKKNYFTNNIFKNIMLFLESRLDNFIYRCGFSSSRNEAKQMINHKFIKLNNYICKQPSKILKPGDYVSINLKKNFFRVDYFKKYYINLYFPNWIFINNNDFSSYLKRLPTILELKDYFNFKENLILGNCKF